MERKFSGTFSNDEVFAWIDNVLETNNTRDPIGITVSNRLFQRGISGERGGVKIAMEPDLYPEDIVKVHFRD